MRSMLTVAAVTILAACSGEPEKADASAINAQSNVIQTTSLSHQQASSNTAAPEKISSASTGPTTEWIVGPWISYEGGNKRDLSACDGDSGMTIEADGKYYMATETGTWSLRGEHIVMAATEAVGGATPEDVEIGKVHRNKVTRVGDGEMRFTYPDGTSLTMLRCPS